MTFTQLLNRVAELSDRRAEKWAAETRAALPDYPFVRPGDVEPEPPAEEAELKALLSSLPDETLYAVAMVLWVGTWGFPVDDLPALKEKIKDRFGERESAIRRLISIAGMSLEMADGIERFRRGGHEVENLIHPVAAAA